jgi:hypothetical protein
MGRRDTRRTEVERWSENGQHWWDRNAVYIYAKILVEVYEIDSEGNETLIESYTERKKVGEESTSSN